ncbi:hypothetical protein A6A07_13890 [Streptomyces sp. CB03911]|nr:hypothetical protein A6A07_13890 [Streptomyces sp. CB03911]
MGGQGEEKETVVGWEQQLAEQMFRPAREKAQEQPTGDAEGARAGELADRSSRLTIARRRALPPAPEWARRAAEAAGLGEGPPDAA